MIKHNILSANLYVTDIENIYHITPGTGTTWACQLNVNRFLFCKEFIRKEYVLLLESRERFHFNESCLSVCLVYKSRTAWGIFLIVCTTAKESIAIELIKPKILVS